MPRHCGNCNITYNDGRYCRRCGNLLVETNTPQQQDQMARTMKKPSKFPPAILIIHAVAYMAMAIIFNESERHSTMGLEALLNVPIWFGLIIVSFLFLLISRSNMVYKLTLLFTALSFPWVLGPVLNPVFSPVTDYVNEVQRIREGASFEAKKQAGYKHLRRLFKKPQRVVNTNRLYIELENGLCLDLRIDYIGHSEEIQDYLKTRLIGQKIRVAIPNPTAGSTAYVPGRQISRCRNLETYIEYDLVPAYVFLGDELLNATILKKWKPDVNESDISRLTAEAQKYVATTDDK